ncbi:Hypothetical protein PP7435_CHR1-0050 [Komagataella phaffii CBS 7435]|uniref:Molybdopterin synthase sulfur carrier subunit n=2 Tax=Komagataella phaffii TaxID=460519 RepID=C4QV35_KOMPG|nr:uncharacterized protein PAS_chr1-3_0292 [Komagataella phaffii GS115]CAH2445760.1 Hypothetical protein BQ9382_C1-0245 [Komagataella phaffii CBS 7435]CAY67105.1 hypothetical protein PAS_chr1-3_0292 [Komagataella phaffii GS115]CCA36219.1 Hypothetical protein PP7435_CHR1-0050 [Komagataella phaffii CBS 7435]
MAIHVEYFGPATDVTHKRDDLITMESYPVSLNKVWSWINEKYGTEFGDYIITACNIALNTEYIDFDKEKPTLAFDQVQVKDGDEVVILPPVSSG